MQTLFYINISIRTANGPRRFARFELGNDGEAARALFKNLKGSPEIDPQDILFIEFMETANDLPLHLDMLTCDLQELSINTMLITQEIFRLSNLKNNQS